MKGTTLLFALLILIFVYIASAQVVPEQTQHPETKKDEEVDTAGEEPVPEPEASTLFGYVSSPDVTSSAFFPKHQSKKFPVGDTVDVLLGFGNTGDKPFKVLGIKAHLVSPQDFQYFLHNFTGVAYNVTVEPDEVNTLQYKFKIDRNIDTREFGFIVDVYYQNLENDQFATTFVNETITFTEAEEGFDPKNLVSYAVLAVVIGVIGFVFFKMLGNASFAKRFTKAKKEEVVDIDSTSTDVNKEWLPAHLTNMKLKKKKEEGK